MRGVEPGSCCAILVASLCVRRPSEFRELALTGRYCRVHLASVQFGRGYEPIDFPYSALYGRWSGRHCPHRNPVSYCLGARVTRRERGQTLPVVSAVGRSIGRTRRAERRVNRRGSLPRQRLDRARAT